MVEIDAGSFMSNRERKKAALIAVAIKIKSLAEVFSPVLDLIALKKHDMNAALKECERLTTWQQSKGDGGEEDHDLGITLEDHFWEMCVCAASLCKQRRIPASLEARSGLL